MSHLGNGKYGKLRKPLTWLFITAQWMQCHWEGPGNYRYGQQRNTPSSQEVQNISADDLLSGQAGCELSDGD